MSSTECVDFLVIISPIVIFVERHFSVFDSAPVLAIYQMPEKRREKKILFKS